MSYIIMIKPAYCNTGVYRRKLDGMARDSYYSYGVTLRHATVGNSVKVNYPTESVRVAARVLALSLHLAGLGVLHTSL